MYGTAHTHPLIPKLSSITSAMNRYMGAARIEEEEARPQIAPARQLAVYCNVQTAT
jgi:hypothetical protein